MAKGFDVLHISSAKKAYNNIDISRDHLTTLDFGQIGVLCHEPSIPDDDFVCKASYFARMAPLVKPTYGKFLFKTVTAFCPYHMIAEDSDAFFAGRSTWQGKTPNLRWMLFSEFWSFLHNDCSVAGSASDFDFAFVSSSGTQGYRKLTAVGKVYVKMLTQLGYTIPENIDLQTGSRWLVNVSGMKLNIMPILAFAKVYNDWMSQSQRYNTSQLTSLLRAIKHNETVSTLYSNNALTHYGLLAILQHILLCYDTGYFTSAWRYPNTPLTSTPEGISSAEVPQSSDPVLHKANFVGSNLQDNYTHSAIVGGSQWQNLQVIGQRALDFLQAFDNWVRRNNYSGSREVQQVYSRFGIKTSDYRSNYADVISTSSTRVTVGDVTATASSTSEPLGDYAGKGIMDCGDAVQYKCNDYGLFMILGYFTVVPMYPFGFDKEVLKTEPLDFYNPEFDGLGADAISFGEVFENPKVLLSDNDGTILSDVYGFTERYNSYRFGKDQVTGDFRNFDNLGDMNVWHLARLLTAVRLAGNMVAQSTSMVQMDNVNSEFNRIFSITNGSVDHFYLTCQFNFSGTKRPMMNLNQVPRLGEGDTSVPRNGNIIS